jgi:hypothetical protein
MATGPLLNILLCQKIFFIYGGYRTIAKYRCVEKYFLSMVATGPLLNISLCQKYFFLFMVATGPLLNILLCQKIFFIYGGYRTIAKYIAVSKNIFYLWRQPDHC